MKRKGFITLLVLVSYCFTAFSITELESPSPSRTQWSFDIEWDNSNCDCGTLEVEKLAWAVYYWSNNKWDLIAGEGWVDVSSLTEYTAYSTVPVSPCPDCYKYCAKVQYEDGSGVCCYGEACVIDNSPLVEDILVSITMN